MSIRERIEKLGSAATTDPRRVAEVTTVGYRPEADEEAPAPLNRLLDAHGAIFDNVLESMEASAGLGPERGSDPILEGVLRCHRQQVRVLLMLLVEHRRTSREGGRY